MSEGIIFAEQLAYGSESYMCSVLYSLHSRGAQQPEDVMITVAFMDNSTEATKGLSY